MALMDGPGIASQNLGGGGQNQRWFTDKGDETFALNWADIDSDSTVWEIGGFEGRWAAQMVEKYNPFISIFEPQPWAVTRLNDKFGANNKVSILPFGLWVMDAHLPLYKYETDGASLLDEGARTQVCEFKDIHPRAHGNVDVCLMNVEGAEFVLIPYLMGLGLMKNFRYFWCQFHTFVPDADLRANGIYKGMLQTHKKIWDYYPTAVAWERLPHPALSRGKRGKA